MENVELSLEEKCILEVMFRMMIPVLDKCEVFPENEGSFDVGDLYQLADKFGINIRSW